MATITIPLTTLPVGSHDAGPAAIADADSLVVVTIDRSVAGGLNALTSATQVKMTAFQSNDGGTTFSELASATVVGGTPPKGGTQTILTVHLWPGTSRQVKANITVTGTAVAVSGTVVTS